MSDRRFCSACGSPRTPGAEVCGACGTSSRAEQSPQQTTADGSTRAPEEWRFDFSTPLPPGSTPPGRAPGRRPGPGASDSRRDAWDRSATVAGPSGPSTPATPGPPPAATLSRGAGGGRRLLALAGALVALVILAGSTTVVLLLSRGDDEPSGSTSPAPVDGPAEGASPGSAEPAPPVTRARVVCWDGARATSLNACSSPSGQAGLDFLFPQRGDQDCEPEPEPSQPARLILWECDVVLSGGATAEVNYSAWTDIGSARAYYEGLALRGSITDRPGVTGWYVQSGQPYPFKAALLYDSVPYSVTVYGASADDREVLLDQLQMVPAAEVRGTVR